MSLKSWIKLLLLKLDPSVKVTFWITLSVCLCSLLFFIHTYIIYVFIICIFVNCLYKHQIGIMGSGGLGLNFELPRVFECPFSLYFSQGKIICTVEQCLHVDLLKVVIYRISFK